MKSRALPFFLATALFVLSSAAALAETSQFVSPSVRGVRLDWCAHFGSDCGKPAADLFCREIGFATATTFSIDQNAGQRGIATLVFGDGRMCQGPTCSGFRVITCTRPDAPAAKPPTIMVVPAPPPAETKPPTVVAPIAPVMPVMPAVPIQPKPPVTTVVPIAPIVPQAPGNQAIVPIPPTIAAPPGLRPLPPTPSPPRPSPPAVGGGVNPIFAMPGSASLYRCVRSDCEFAVSLDLEIDPNATNQTGDFGGDVSKVGTAAGFRWQVTTKPFPAFVGGAQSDIQPPGLVASGEELFKQRRFFPDFKQIAATLPRGQTLPDSFYVRILPIYGPAVTLPAGQPSNVIRVYYAGAPPPQAPIKIYDTSPPHLFSVRLVSFTPPDFENPNRWGCVVVEGYKEPLVGVGGDIWKSAYPVGGEVCPASFKGGSSYQITSFGEFVDWLSGGVTDAMDWVSERYEDLKQVAVDIVMKYTPFGLQCEAIGKLIDDDAPGYCELAANIAVNAGLAALGLPPSIPNYNQLIDQGVDHAVELAVAEIEAQTGVPCFGPCADALRDGFATAADELKKSSYTPGCVGTEEAHKHGREPLCVPDFIIAKPAPGAVYTPPVAVVSVTRLNAERNPDSLFDQKCQVSVGITFKNWFPGGTVWGPFNNTMAVPAQAISGQLYSGEGSDLAEGVAKGSSRTFVFTFTQPVKFQFSWTRQLWLQSQTVQRDEAGPMGPDWFTLYRNAEATVGAGVNCAAAGHSLTYRMPDL
ncbi:MAG: hypothetical protein WD036_01150 [Bauldia sp.]